MIQDSIPWKDELLAIALRLEKKTTQKRWTDRTGFLVERDLMVSAYAIRKLVEAYKVSDELVRRQFALERFALIDEARVPDLLGRYAVWEYYDLEKPTKTVLPLVKLCNQIVHSWLWALSASEDDGLLDGVFVSSDTTRSKWLFRIPMSGYIALCREIGNEEVFKTAMMRKTPGGPMEYIEILGRRWTGLDAPE